MQRRIEALAAAGVPAEIEVFPHLGHGFGLGVGMSVEGWMEEAIAFWGQEGLEGAWAVEDALGTEEQGQAVDAQLMVPSSGTVLDAAVDASLPPWAIRPLWWTTTCGRLPRKRGRWTRPAPCGLCAPARVTTA